MHATDFCYFHRSTYYYHPIPMRGTSFALFTLLLLLACPDIGAQNPTSGLYFQPTAYDFGLIREEEGIVEYEFTLNNTTDRPVKIDSVQASCGCTATAWSLDTIAPSGKGFVKVNFDPSNRPGFFSKSITVKTDYPDDKYKSMSLMIKGKVRPISGPIVEAMPVRMGRLRFKHRVWNLGKVYTTPTAMVKEFQVYNDSDTLLTFIDSLSYAPAHVRVEAYPRQLAPKTMGIIRLHYDAKAKAEYGFMNESIQLVTDEAKEARKHITLYTTIEEYFPQQSNEVLREAPRAQLSSRRVDFREIDEGQVFHTSIELSNIGRSPLILRKVKPNCSCIRYRLANNQKTLQQGERVTMDLWFDTSGRRGNQQKSILIYTNDPREPVRKFILRGRIKASDKGEVVR